MDKKELKEKYKADFIIIREFVNAFAPCGLIEGDAPIDEYDCLTQQLLSSIYNKMNIQQMKDLILNELEHNFGTADLTNLNKQYQRKFYKDLDKFLYNINDKFYKNEISTTA